jgi:hypothetical protein
MRQRKAMEVNAIVVENEQLSKPIRTSVLDGLVDEWV